MEITEVSSGVYRWLSKPPTLEYQEIKTITVYIYTYTMRVIFIRIFRLLVSGRVSLYTARQCRDTRATGDWLPDSKKISREI